MAIAATNLLATGSATVGSSYNTASVNVVTGRLYLLTVRSRRNNAGDANQPTVSGASQTWDAVDTHLTASSTRQRITLFRCMPTSDASGALTIDFASQNQTGAQWILEEFTGALAGSNGATAVIQSVDGEAASASSFSLALAAFAKASNAAYMVGNTPTAVVGVTPEAGHTELCEYTSPSFTGSGLQVSMYKPTSDASPSWTYDVADGTNGAIAVEIAAAMPRSFAMVIG